MKTRTRWLLASVLGLAFIAGAALAWKGWHRSAVIAAALPPVPEFAGRPPELARAVADAESRALRGPAEVAALAELSRLYHANGYLGEALLCYEALERVDPGTPYWSYRYAMIVSGFGRVEPAVARLDRVLAMEPTYGPAHLRLGEILLKHGDVSRAAAAFQRLLRLDGDNPHALLGLARCAFEGGDWQGARGHLERVVRQTDFRVGYDLIVTVYEKLNLHAEAAQVRGRAKFSGAYRDFADPWMEELMDDCFDAFQLSLAAGLAKDRGNLASARRLLERALRFSPADATLHFQLGLVLNATGEHTLARRHLERCTELAPGFADGWAHLTGLLDTVGDRAGAQRVFAQGLAECPESPGLHQMRALQLRQQGQMEQALWHFRKSIELRPTEADAHVELAMTLFKLSRVEEGMAALESALRAEPGHPVVLTSLVYGAISMGDAPKARARLREARNQPRVDRAEVQGLEALFQRTFGTPAE